MAQTQSNPFSPLSLDFSAVPKPPTTPAKKAPPTPTNNLSDLFARLMSFSIGPSMASRGVPPGLPTGPGSGALATPRFAFNPMRIG